MTQQQHVSSPRILITGADGQLGWELRRTLSPLGTVTATAMPGAPGGDHALDLARPEPIRALLRELRPDIVINAAAYTAVDRAEDEPELARAVNALAPGVLAEEVAKLGGLIVHYSTDYVFDGAQDRPYLESDPPAPLGVYGRTKLEGEQAVAAAADSHLVFRTSWVYASRGRNFLLTMLKVAQERRELRVVDDQRGAPTAARFLAEATAQVIAQCRVAGCDWLRERSGLYHLAAGGVCSWYEFAAAILAHRPSGPDSRLVPIPTAEYPTRAARPRWSVLDCNQVRETFGIRCPHWRAQLELVMEEVLGSA